MAPQLRSPLLVRVALMLAATGLLPVAISFFMLRTNKDALLDQAYRTHMVAAKTAADRVDAYVESLRELALSLATHPVLYGDPHSPAAQELLRGTLGTRSAIGVVGIFNPAGQQVVRAQRPGMGEEIAAVWEADDAPLAVVAGASQRWLRIREPIPDDLGELILIADAEQIDPVVAAREMGEAAHLVVMSQAGEVLFGHDLTAADFPAEKVDEATSGKIGSGGGRSRGPQGEELIVAYSRLQAAPWVVLSRQPARIAVEAQRKMRQATWVAAVGTMLLTLVLSGAAWSTVIRPLRRLARAQRALAGAGAGPAAGSEIAQLEESFALLEQRVRDQQDLGKVFLGRYQVVEVLGSGGMGTVFRAWDPKLQRPVALKTIRLTAEDFKREKLISVLLKEAVTSAKFNHPNIVTVYDVADEGAAAFIAMEFVDGVSLEAYLSTHGRVEWWEIIPLGSAIARGLAQAHENGLVHQDVKPANILLGRDESIKVTDFGMSQLISSATREHDVICGTPGYIAPEIFSGEGYTAYSDLFSLGVLLWECLVGQHPFTGLTMHKTILNTIKVQPQPLRELYPDLPRELAELVARLVAKDPVERPAAALAVAEAFEEMAAARELRWTPRMLPTTEVMETRSTIRRSQLIPLDVTSRTVRPPD